ncbi:MULTISPECIES: hypothetical protein [Amycolatopsis]|nr:MULTISPECIES: hypothetical protein [Amycolatopsis]
MPDQPARRTRWSDAELMALDTNPQARLVIVEGMISGISSGR